MFLVLFPIDQLLILARPEDYFILVGGKWSLKANM